MNISFGEAITFGFFLLALLTYIDKRKNPLLRFAPKWVTSWSFSIFKEKFPLKMFIPGSSRAAAPYFYSY
ncbi:hypothetical protein G8C92_28145 [Paenibacillus donghaensis]|uniref:hypothetical protein n=1 Tax=Paenibacillus donghaensis TaxID=414771 RepID=UPI0018844F1A|nr:hypothetical protein [Paenibacillus donghaensis]MBE9917876.1 hypothetical protein [Paenibacillus donghaensis]